MGKKKEILRSLDILWIVTGILASAVVILISTLFDKGIITWKDFLEDTSGG